MPAQDFAGLKGERNLRALEGPTLAYWRVFLNTAKAPLEKKPVREAMNLALDRPTLLKTIIFGLGEVVASPFPAGYWANNPALKPWPYDPARAGLGTGTTSRRAVRPR